MKEKIAIVQNISTSLFTEDCTPVETAAATEGYLQQVSMNAVMNDKRENCCILIS